MWRIGPGEVGADLRGAHLYAATLREADLYGAELYGANLNWVALSGADLRGANLNSTSLNGADLRGADLRDAIGLTQAQLDEAIIDSDTQLPSGGE